MSRQRTWTDERADSGAPCSGIGLESAILFASEGAHVVCADIRPEAVEKTVALISEIVADAPRAVAVACDVGKEADIKSMVDKAVSEFGRLDVIFNNAGISECQCLCIRHQMGTSMQAECGDLARRSAPSRRRW